MSDSHVAVPEYIARLYDWVYFYKFMLPFSSYPLHRQERYRPFFIVGSGRSGNTLLRRILYAHPSIHIPPETYILGQCIRIFRRYRMMTWQDLTYLILSRFEYHPEFGTFQMSLRPLAEQLLNTPKANRSLAYMLNSFYQYVAKTQGKEGARWGDKTPLNTFYLERILGVFPDAQFIHIVRDGCDVAVSYYQSGFYKDIFSAADRWLASVKAAKLFTKRHPQSVLEIRYEDLVSQSEVTVKKVCNFLEIEFHQSMLESRSLVGEMGDVPMREHHRQAMNPISTSNIGKGRQHLTEEEKYLLHQKIGEYLLQLGYPPLHE
jgi:hypothetical protein